MNKILIGMFLILLIPLSFAVNECDGDLNFGGSRAGADGTNNNSCTTTANPFILNGTYTLYMNGSAGGVIVPTTNNQVIDCNNTLIIGNYTTGSIETTIYFGKAGGNNGVTWQNCRFEKFYNGVGFRSAETSGNVINFTINNTYVGIDIMTGQNIKVINNTFLKTDQYGIYLEPNSNLWYNATIDGNRFIDAVARPIYADGHKNVAKTILIQNNYISNGTGSQGGIYVNLVNNVTIKGNIITSNRTGLRALLSSTGMQLGSNSNVSITLNNISGYDSGFTFTTQKRLWDTSAWDCGNITSNVLIAKNRMFNNDRGMRIRGTTLTNVSSNTFLNNTDGVDAYDVQLYFEECNSYVNVENNTFSQTGSTGIWAEAMQGMKIYGNTFDMLTDAEKTARKVNDIYEYPAAIQISEEYKSFLQGNRTEPVLLSQFQRMASNNITISGNTFDSDTRTFLILQGTTNVTHDLTNYWYRKWSYVDIYSDPIEYYNSNSYTRLYWTTSLGTIRDLGYYSYGNTTDVYTKIGVNFTSTSVMFNNTDTLSHVQTIFGSTRGLLTYNNGTNIININGNNAFYLAPSQYFLFRDNYYSSDSMATCNAATQGLITSFMSYCILVGLIGTLVFIGFGIAYLSGILDKNTFTAAGVISAVTTLILVSVLIIIGIVIFSSLCNV